MGYFRKKNLEIAYYSNVIINLNISYLRSKIVRKTIAFGTEFALEFRKNILPKEKNHRNPNKTGSWRGVGPSLHNEPGLTRERVFFSENKITVPKYCTFSPFYEKTVLRFFVQHLWCYQTAITSCRFCSIFCACNSQNVQ